MLNNQALKALYDIFPDWVKRIFLNKDFDALLNKVNLRKKLVERLEKVEID